MSLSIQPPVLLLSLPLLLLGCSGEKDDSGEPSAAFADAVITGEDDYGMVGMSMDAAGDVNADGYDDVLIGVSLNDGAADGGGAIFIFNGPLSGERTTSEADAAILGASQYEGIGSTFTAGDLNNDGYADILAVNTGGYKQVPCVYVIPGPASGDHVVSSDHIGILGDMGQYMQTGDMGDVNGDGLLDVIVGDFTARDVGMAWIVNGPIVSRTLAEADASFVGEQYDDSAGYHVSIIGDVNGDGFADALVRASHNGAGLGAVYLLFAPFKGELSLSEADVKIVGISALEPLGWTMSSAGDVNGDGLADFLVTTFPYSKHGQVNGTAYLFEGPSPSGDLDLATASFVGETDSESVGSSATGPGDVNGDTYGDLLIGAETGGPHAEGETCLFYGPVSGSYGISMGDEIFVGESMGNLAGEVSDAGDVDGDGKPDFLIGAPGHGEGFSMTGAAYLVYAGGL